VLDRALDGTDVAHCWLIRVQDLCISRLGQDVVLCSSRMMESLARMRFLEYGVVISQRSILVCRDCWSVVDEGRMEFLSAGYTSTPRRSDPALGCLTFRASLLVGCQDFAAALGDEQRWRHGGRTRLGLWRQCSLGQDWSHRCGVFEERVRASLP
jgi:hypothetical protein